LDASLEVASDKVAEHFFRAGVQPVGCGNGLKSKNLCGWG
jgi:hypothetical protein